LSFLNTYKSSLAMGAVFPQNSLASYEALSPSPLFPGFFSPVFLCLPSEADASIFLISYGVSLFLAEVTQVNSISVSPIQGTQICVPWPVAWGCPVSKFPGQPVRSLPTKPHYVRGRRLLYLVAMDELFVVWLSGL
jgi:hypothetical protein